MADHSSKSSILDSEESRTPDPLVHRQMSRRQQTFLRRNRNTKLEKHLATQQPGEATAETMKGQESLPAIYKQITRHFKGPPTSGSDLSSKKGGDSPPIEQQQTKAHLNSHNVQSQVQSQGSFIAPSNINLDTSKFESDHHPNTHFSPTEDATTRKDETGGIASHNVFLNQKSVNRNITQSASGMDVHRIDNIFEEIRKQHTKQVTRINMLDPKDIAEQSSSNVNTAKPPEPHGRRSSFRSQLSPGGSHSNSMYYGQPVEEGSMRSFMLDLENHKAHIEEKNEVKKSMILTTKLVDQYILEKMTKIAKKRETIRREIVEHQLELSESEESSETHPLQTEEDSSYQMSMIEEEDESSKASVQDYFIKRNSPKLTNQVTYLFPPGYAPAADPDKDRVKQELEEQERLEKEKKKVLKILKLRIKEEYETKFKQEVDVHHRVAYAFENAYKLGRRFPERKETLDMEIICILSDHSDYIFSDPMVLFYSLFFCVFYDNAFLLQFLKTLIDKIRISSHSTRSRIERFIEIVDDYGIERVRTFGEVINTRAYHMVLFSAMDDKLRIVYSKIIRKLNLLMVRDRDAKLLLTTYDFELMRTVLGKRPAKLNPKEFHGIEHNIARFYKTYTAAFFEELLLELDYDTQWRVAKQYRERFLITEQTIMEVLEMYAQKDHMDHFLKREHSKLSYNKFIELFQSCIKNDSFKLGMQIYLRYLQGKGVSLKTMSMLINSVRDSPKYFEIKLFFLLEHFQTMDVEEISRLVDILIVIINRRKYENSPILNSYNTIKVAILMYRVTWLIENKNLYSLVTKCRILRTYIENSLDSYLSLQTNVEQLYRFMLEPVLSMRNTQDSLDLMLEMDMQRTLNHNVIIEVLNLVNEGLYSIDSSALFLSQTLWALFQLPTFHAKRVWDRLESNIKNLEGTADDKQQASLQFHIWKKCTRQRLIDETIFIFVFSLVFLYYALVLEHYTNRYITLENKALGKSYLRDKDGFAHLPKPTLAAFCPEATEILIDFAVTQNHYSIVAYYCALSMALSFLTKLLQKWRKPDIFLDYLVLASEAIIVLSALILAAKESQDTIDPLIADVCQTVMKMPEDHLIDAEHGFYFLTDYGHWESYQLIVSSNIFLFSLYSIVLLKRTERFGPLINQMEQMMFEVLKFFATVGFIYLILFGVLRFSHYYIKLGSEPLFETVLVTVDSLLGKTRIEEFRHPFGGVYIISMSFILKGFLFSILATMFVVRWLAAWSHIEATKRKQIIKLKGTHAYDPLFGSVTTSFFPINVFMIIFGLPVLCLRSPRFNNAMLQVQYYLMIVFYVVIVAPVAVLLAPALYVKLIVNQIFIMKEAGRSKMLGNIGHLAGVLFIGPFMILASLGADLIKLNQTLMREERHFEYKYVHSNIMDDINKEVIMKSFYTTFIIDFEKKYRGKGKNEHDTMLQHRASFRILDMFHSVFCRGDKTYNDAVYNIKLFNYSKILSYRCSIPSIFGEKRLDYLNYDLIHNIFEDILIFNFSEFCLNQFRMGVNFDYILDDLYKYGYPHRDYDMEKHEFCSTLTRDASDCFNFFCISIVSKSFTDVLEVGRQYQLETNFWYTKKQAKMINRLRRDWIDLISREGADELLAKMVAAVEEDLQRRQFHKKMSASHRTRKQIKSGLLSMV